MLSIAMPAKKINQVFLFAGLCPDWDSWDQTKPVDNAREAMQQADDWLGVPQVLYLRSVISGLFINS